MGILENGPNGGYRGKAGSYIGYYRKGQWIIQGIPKLSAKNKVGSKSQNVYRSRFRDLNEFLLPMLPLINIGFQNEARTKNAIPYNLAKSWNLKNAFNSENEIDYSSILLSYGPLPGVEEAGVTAVEGGLLFSWPYSEERLANGSVLTNHNDHVMVIANNLKGLSYSMVGGCRSDGSFLLKMNPPIGDQWHTWISFMTFNREHVSMSSHLGVVEY